MSENSLTNLESVGSIPSPDSPTNAEKHDSVGRGMRAVIVVAMSMSLFVAMAAAVLSVIKGWDGDGGYNSRCSALIAIFHAVFSAVCLAGLRLSLLNRRSLVFARIVLGVFLFFTGLTYTELAAGIRYRRAPERMTPFQSDAELGWRLRANFSSSYSGARLETNEEGFRSAPVSRGKDANTIRVISLGDSITFGQGCEATDAYPQIAQRMMAAKLSRKRVEFINTGVPGYCTFQETEILRRCLDKGYDPDLVVLLICLNDITEKYLALKSFGGTGLGYHGVADGGAGKLFHWMVAYRRYSSLLSALTPTRVTAEKREAYSVRALWDRAQSPEIVEAWRQQEEEIEELRELCDRHGLGLVVAVAPYRLQFIGSEISNEPQERLAKFVEQQGIEFLDLKPAFADVAADRDVQPETFFRDGAHFTAEGNVIIADAVVKAMALMPKEPAAQTSWRRSVQHLFGESK